MAREAGSESLFVTDAEAARRLGLSPSEWARISPMFHRLGMPLPCPITHRLYWPAVRAFLDRHYGLAPIRPAALAVATKPDGEENIDALRSPKSQRTRAGHQATR